MKFSPGGFVLPMGTTKPPEEKLIGPREGYEIDRARRFSGSADAKSEHIWCYSGSWRPNIAIFLRGGQNPKIEIFELGGLYSVKKPAEAIASGPRSIWGRESVQKSILLHLFFGFWCFSAIDYILFGHIYGICSTFGAFFGGAKVAKITKITKSSKTPPNMYIKVPWGLASR